MSEAVNPYESPQIAAISNSQATAPAAAGNRDTTIAALEWRVAELERQLTQSWFMSPLRYRRVLAVWGYWMLGYAAFALIIMPIVLLFEWLGRRW